MGLISPNTKWCFQMSLNLSLLFGIILVTPRIPPNVKFQSFTVTPPIKFENELEINSILDTSKIFSEKQVVSLVVQGSDIYTGESNGNILKIDKNRKATKIGQFTYQCYRESKEKCSFPTGMKFDPQGRLIYTDIYGGLIRVDINTGKQETIVPRWELIENRYPILSNDLDITKNGIIYWTDGSTNEEFTSLSHLFPSIFLGSPEGRLLKYDPKVNKTEVLLNRLHVSTGISLSKNEDFVIVAESIKCRIVKYYLKGSKKGETDLFLDGLPGHPQSIWSNGNGLFYITFSAVRNENFEFRYLPSQPLLRKLFARLTFLIQYAIEGIEIYLLPGNEFLKSLHNYLGHWGPFLSIEDSPKHGLVLEVDEEGTIHRSFHSIKGEIWNLSHFSLGTHYAYFISPLNSKIWRIKRNDLEM